MCGLLSLTGCDKLAGILESRNDSKSRKGSNDSDELLYQTALTELKLAETGKPYLVFDVPGNALEIRVKGATVLCAPFEVIEDKASALDKFLHRFSQGQGRLLRPLAGKYLFAAQQQTPDSVLRIVSEVINVKPELMQRQIPRRFRLIWDNKLILDCVSDVEVDERAAGLEEKLQNTMMEARYVLRRPFGATLLVLKTSPENATTIYRAVDRGTPTLLQLVKTDLEPDKGKGRKR